LAKKKRDAEEEEEGTGKSGFPKFDEKEFYRKEMRETKMMFISVGLAMFIGIMCGIMTNAGLDARIAAILAIFAVFFLKFAFDAFKISTEGLEKMKWLSMIGTYFLTLIAVWVLIMNPPIIDMVDPVVVNETPGAMEVRENVAITVKATDNLALKGITIVVTDPDFKATPVSGMRALGRGYYEYQITAPQVGNYKYEVTAKDRTGHTTIFRDEFDVVDYSPPEIQLYNAPMNPRVGDQIKVSISDNTDVATAYYSVDPVDDDWYTRPGNAEKGLELSEDGIGIIDTNDWTPGTHTLHVMAMDKVPHSRTEAVFTFTLS
jgi:uncharacterized membrane protein YphA (DoxX/SURF4 family)